MRTEKFERLDDPIEPLQTGLRAGFRFCILNKPTAKDGLSEDSAIATASQLQSTVLALLCCATHWARHPIT